MAHNEHSTDVSRNDAAHRYVIHVDGQEAGYAEYVPRDGFLDFNHTVIYEQFQGMGLSKKLIGGALDAVRADGNKIKATCSAVSGFLAKNPQYGDLEV